MLSFHLIHSSQHLHHSRQLGATQVCIWIKLPLGLGLWSIGDGTMGSFRKLPEGTIKLANVEGMMLKDFEALFLACQILRLKKWYVNSSTLISGLFSILILHKFLSNQLISRSISTCSAFQSILIIKRNFLVYAGVELLHLLASSMSSSLDL